MTTLQYSIIGLIVTCMFSFTSLYISIMTYLNIERQVQCVVYRQCK